MLTVQLTSEQRQQVEKHVKFARWYAREFGATPSEREEAVAICMMALAQAATSYDPSRGAQFHTYAGVLMKRALIAAWRQKQRLASTFLEDAARVPDDSSAHGFADERALAWLRTKGMQIASANEVEHAILSSFFEHAHLHSIARKFGYSVVAIRRRRDTLFAVLREQATIDGLI